jgi:magnesium chelatase family protein
VNTTPCEPMDFQEIKGQEHVKRGLEVAAAGGHHVLLIGPPQSGKTMLARALHGILPPLSERETGETRTIMGQAGAEGERLQDRRPWVAPKAASSSAALFGGGTGRVRPGAVSQAHHGLLLIDDLPALGSKLKTLATVITDQAVRIERAGGSITLPAAFQLVATMQPCLCGWHGDAERECSCSPASVRRYQQRIPDPLRERIEIHLEVPRLAYERYTSQRLGEPSAAVMHRVVQVRQRQADRFKGNPHCSTNAEMRPGEIRAYCQLDGAGQALMKAAVRQLTLSASGYHRVLRVARSIADLAHAEQIGPAHLAEAVQYRARTT